MPPQRPASLTKRDQLVGLGEIARRVDQRAADAHRAFVHRLADQRPHPGELRRIGIDVALAELVDADRRRADEARDVGRDAAALEDVRDIRRASSRRSDSGCRPGARARAASSRG